MSGILIGLALVFLFPGVSGAAGNPHGDLKADCRECHTTASWTDVRFSHQGMGFDLTGSHREVACSRCHDLTDFSRAGRACRDCHRDVHLSRLGPDCERCHTPHGWDVFDVEEIHARTRFSLLERHVLIDCRNCHPALLEGDFATSAIDCVACHEGDYLATTSPGHVALGISTICSGCHEPVRWHPALFPSHDPIFPIFSGAHEGVWGECADCHPDPSTFSVFTCLPCHPRPAMDEEHRGIPGYGYDSNLCYLCHPTGQRGEFREHDTLYFPIYSGAHSGRWDDCTVCHVDPDDRSVFSCIGCHEHDQSTMDEKHREVPGYVYDSQACYNCHPDGGERVQWRRHRTVE